MEGRALSRPTIWDDTEVVPPSGRVAAGPGGNTRCGCSRCIKFSLPLDATALERALHRLDNCLANAGRIAKTNFAFRRMDVDVYFTWIQINEQKRNRKLSAHESGVITFAQGGREDSAFNRASVYENELLCSRLPAHPSATDPALNLNTTPITQGNFEQVVEELRTIEIADPVSQRGRYRQLQTQCYLPAPG